MGNSAMSQRYVGHVMVAVVEAIADLPKPLGEAAGRSWEGRRGRAQRRESRDGGAYRPQLMPSSRSAPMVAINRIARCCANVVLQLERPWSPDAVSCPPRLSG
jgi:hypothetical protein